MERVLPTSTRVICFESDEIPSLSIGCAVLMMKYNRIKKAPHFFYGAFSGKDDFNVYDRVETSSYASIGRQLHTKFLSP